MIDKVLDYERNLFFALNGSESEYLDRFMWLYSGKTVWLPVAALIIFILLYKKMWKESLFIVLSITLVVVLCDQFASGVCKPYFHRFRPTHHPDFMNEVDTVFNYRGGKYGFMSSHAANAFGFAMFMAYLFKNALFSWTIFIWATLTAYSRIYLGVHFISDVVPGIVVGLLVGYGVYRLYKWSRSRILAKAAVVAPPYAMYSYRQKCVAAGGICVTAAVLLLFNSLLVSLLR
ncbi:phosphatase PAP2 family protein [Bacteroides sp. 214]|uniref:phosphatase PAP2 family protein n=1 Tax=Bacteroides sp. 214 TaxID=2302935 RepID=UPI0013D43F9A|nr:phosphatase PAP2 family protein [Bacteroides sp. 214]NDW13368.1 phosphatase PAP2 family protein [Bacteroides sp. 214]